MYSRNVTRRSFLKLAGVLALRAAVVGAGGASYVAAVEPEWVEINPVGLGLPRLSPAFHGYRIAQISDLHMGDWLDANKLAEIVALVNKQKPDMIVITGDFVTRHPEYVASDLAKSLSKLSAPDGVMAVLGNHDYRPGPDVIRHVMQDSGITNLSNGVHTLERASALLNIAGVDDVWQGKDRLDLVLNKLPKAGAALLLTHEPDFADISAATGRFDLQISGHSHGGQVNIPFLGPMRLPPLGRKYPLGLYRVGEMIQYTNRGIGMVYPHVRFNCRPEITLFTLSSSAT